MYHHSSSSPARSQADLRKAHGLLWLTLLLTLFTYIIGATWDGIWHRTRVFDTFYSPPHLFIYIMVFVITILVIYITFTPRLRAWFGPGFYVLPVPFPVPGALVLTGGGLFLLGLAGLLDDFWHSSFGLDETLWSFPHALLGWGLCIVALGFISCVLAFRRFYRPRWYSQLFLSWLAVVCTIGPVLNPFASNRTPEMVWATAHIHILAIQPLAQHTFRIYLTWNLTQTNPLFLLLVTFWLGLILTLARSIEQRAWIVLIVALLSVSNADVHSLTTIVPTISKHAANWLALPVLPAAIILLLLLKLRMRERWAWIITGTLFALLVALIWQPTGLSLLVALLCAPLALLGVRAGRWVYGILEKPRAFSVWGLLFFALSTAFLVGMVDLYLRNVTP